MKIFIAKMSEELQHQQLAKETQETLKVLTQQKSPDELKKYSEELHQVANDGIAGFAHLEEQINSPEGKGELKYGSEIIKKHLTSIAQEGYRLVKEKTEENKNAVNLASLEDLKDSVRNGLDTIKRNLEITKSLEEYRQRLNAFKVKKAATEQQPFATPQEKVSALEDLFLEFGNLGSELNVKKSSDLKDKIVKERDEVKEDLQTKLFESRNGFKMVEQFEQKHLEVNPKYDKYYQIRMSDLPYDQKVQQLEALNQPLLNDFLQLKKMYVSFPETIFPDKVWNSLSPKFRNIDTIIHALTEMKLYFQAAAYLKTNDHYKYFALSGFESGGNVLKIENLNPNSKTGQQFDREQLDRMPEIQKYLQGLRDKNNNENNEAISDNPKQKRFYEGKEKFKNGEIIEAKAFLLEYYQYESGQKLHAVEHNNNLITAQAILKKIARLQVEKARGKLQLVSQTIDSQIPNVDGSTLYGTDNREQAKIYVESMSKVLDQVTEMVESENSPVLTIEEAQQKIKNADTSALKDPTEGMGSTDQVKYYAGLAYDRLWKGKKIEEQDPKLWAAKKYQLGFIGKNGTLNHFDVLQQQIDADETDPVKRKENLVRLARESRKNGLYGLSKHYYETILQDQIVATGKKVISLGMLRNNLANDPQVTDKVDQQMQSWKSDLVAQFTKEYLEKNEKLPTDPEINNYLYAQRTRLLEGVVQERHRRIVMKEVGNALNGAQTPGMEDDKQLYNEAFKDGYLKLDNFSGKDGQEVEGSFIGGFTEEEWNRKKVDLMLNIGLLIPSMRTGAVVAKEVMKGTLVRMIEAKAISDIAKAELMRKSREALQKGGWEAFKFMKEQFGTKEALLLLGKDVAIENTIMNLQAQEMQATYQMFANNDYSLFLDAKAYTKSWAHGVGMMIPGKAGGIGYGAAFGERMAKASNLGKVGYAAGAYGVGVGTMSTADLGMQMAHGKDLTLNSAGAALEQGVIFTIATGFAHQVPGLSEAKPEEAKTRKASRAETAFRKRMNLPESDKPLTSNERLIKNAFDQFEKDKADGLVPKDFVLDNDPEFQKLPRNLHENNEAWMVYNAYFESLMARLSKDILMGDESPQLHQDVLSLENLVDMENPQGVYVKTTDATGKEAVVQGQYRAVKTHTSEDTLPADWTKYQPERHRGVSTFVAGKSFVIELELASEDGSLPKKMYHIVNAEGMNDFNNLITTKSFIKPGDESDAISSRINYETKLLTTRDGRKQLKIIQSNEEKWEKDRANFTQADQLKTHEPFIQLNILNFAYEIFNFGGPDFRGRVVIDPDTGKPFFDGGKLMNYLNKLHEKYKQEKDAATIKEANEKYDPQISTTLMTLADKLQSEVDQGATIKPVGGAVLETVLKDINQIPEGERHLIMSPVDGFEAGKSLIFKIRNPQNGLVSYVIQSYESLISGHNFEESVGRLTTGKSEAGSNELKTTLFELAAVHARKIGSLAGLNKTDRSNINFVQKALEAKKEIGDRTDLTTEQKMALLKARIAEIRKQIGNRENLLTQVINDYLVKIDHAIKNDPNANPDTMVQGILTDPSIIAEFTPGERTRIAETVKATYEKARVIERYYQQFKNNPAQLYEIQFGVKPQGEVRLVKSRYSLGFQMLDPADYQKAGKYETLEKAMKSGGFSSPSSPIFDLRGIVVAINGEHAPKELHEILVHEERHNVNRAILNGMHDGWDQVYHNPVKKIDVAAIEADRKLTTQEGPTDHAKALKEAHRTQRSEINTYFNNILNTSIARAKDEIIAFTKDGSSPRRIKQVLTQKDGLYDYWSNEYYTVINQMLTWDPATTTPEATNLIQTNKSVYRNRHNEIISDAVDAAAQVGDLNLLAVTPIRDWKNLPKKGN